jgi:hypothetical protein
VSNIVAEAGVTWRHPADHPPPKGTKLLLYFYPHGITVIGEWQHSGAALWAPMPRVGQDMKDRLEAEQERRVLKGLKP